MAKHHKRLIFAIAAAITAGAAVIGSATYFSRATNAEEKATDNVRIIDARKPRTQWAINAAYARGALSNLRAALAEIAKNNLLEARKGVTVAQSLLSKIEPTPETESVLVHSEIRLLGHVDEPEVVQAKLDVIRRELDMSDRETIVAALESLHVPLVYTRVNVPLGDTLARVGEVLRALDSENAEMARTRILNIGDGLGVETHRIEGEDPPVAPGSETDDG